MAKRLVFLSVAVLQHQQGHHPRRFMPGIQVAHDGPRNHDTGTGTQALHETQCDQAMDVRCQGTTDAAYAEQREAEVHRQTPSHHVRHRSIDDLAGAHGDEIRHQTGLHRTDGRVHVRADRGQGWQVHVDRERTDCRQQAQHQGDAQETRIHELVCFE